MQKPCQATLEIFFSACTFAKGKNVFPVAGIAGVAPFYPFCQDHCCSSNQPPPPPLSPFFIFWKENEAGRRKSRAEYETSLLLLFFGISYIKDV